MLWRLGQGDMAKGEPPYGKTSNAPKMFFIVLSGIPRNRVLPLFSIQSIQFVLPQYSLILMNKSSSFLLCGNPKNVISTYTQGKRPRTVGGSTGSQSKRNWVPRETKNKNPGGQSWKMQFDSYRAPLPSNTEGSMFDSNLGSLFFFSR